MIYGSYLPLLRPVTIYRSSRGWGSILAASHVQAKSLILRLKCGNCTPKCMVSSLLRHSKHSMILQQPSGEVTQRSSVPGHHVLMILPTVRSGNSALQGRRFRQTMNSIGIFTTTTIVVV